MTPADLYLHRRLWLDGSGETAAEGRTRLPDGFPKASARRLSHLATLLARVLEQLDRQPGDALVFASRYAETRSLEAYLDSFPNPSPTLFQTSVHPGPVQGSCVPRQREVGEFWPVTGGVDLAAQALQIAASCSARRVVLVAGEEQGGWLASLGLASPTAWAAGFDLRHEADGALGVLQAVSAPVKATWNGAEAFHGLATAAAGGLRLPDGSGWMLRLFA